MNLAPLQQVSKTHTMQSHLPSPISPEQSEIKHKVAPPSINPSIPEYDPSTQEERMLSGQLYYSWPPPLEPRRRRAHQLCRQYNGLDEEPDHPEKQKLLKELLGGVGEGCFIEAPFRCDYGTYITLGKNVYMNFNTTIIDAARVTIGDNVLFGPNVCLYSATHPTDPAIRRNWGPELAKPIKIGNDCWLGGSVVVLPGVTIGDGVTVGAGSVVTKDVEPYVVVVGNPARVVKRIPREETLRDSFKLTLPNNIKKQNMEGVETNVVSVQL